MIQRTLFALGMFFTGSLLTAEVSAGPEQAQPKLVAVIVVDGFPQQQAVKYRKQLAEGGLKRFLSQGAWYTNARYGHASTFTAVGHATLLTGAFPYQHGLVGNEWLDRKTRKRVYCVDDPSVQWLEDPGPGRSPRHLEATTLGDELRLATGLKSRVLSISIKDRGAILPGGKLGLAYFLNRQTGRFGTSTFYRKDYPDWWRQFYARRPQDKWFEKAWRPLLSPGAYTLSVPNGQPYVIPLQGLGKAFPHFLKAGLQRPGPAYYGTLASTPFGNDYLLQFVQAAVEGEKLGKNEDGIPDLLAVSFSSHDYVNHYFAPESLESEDSVLRLDRTLAELLRFLDQWVGLEKTLVVLTADHGFPNSPEYCSQLGMEAGRIDSSKMMEDLNLHLSARFGAGKYALAWLNPTFYLDYELIDKKGLSRSRVETVAAEFLRHYRGVAWVLNRSQLLAGQVPPTRLGQQIIRSWNPTISGDLWVVQRNCWYLLGAPHALAATHGSPYSYDTDVPLMFLGPWFRPGKYGGEADVIDIAPTLSYLLSIRPPSGSEGRVLEEILK
ncbi:MAG: alkaline phosphatase family protein [Acidobacteriota bacterium]